MSTKWTIFWGLGSESYLKSILVILADCYATLRDFIEKFDKKKIQKNFREILFLIFFGYHGSTFNLEYACENLGGLGPLVWEEIENVLTVHKGLAKLLYRYVSALW
jgi:hypothetical protein